MDASIGRKRGGASAGKCKSAPWTDASGHKIKTPVDQIQSFCSENLTHGRFMKIFDCYMIVVYGRFALYENSHGVI